MGKFVLVAISIVLLTFLVACTGTSSNDVRVKCPACGYEFDINRK